MNFLNNRKRYQEISPCLEYVPLVNQIESPKLLKLIDDSDIPNLIDTFTDNEINLYNFEMLLVKCDCYDSRIFGADNGLLIYPKMVQGMRKDCKKNCKNLLKTLQLIQNEKNHEFDAKNNNENILLLKKLGFLAASYQNYIDIIIRILGNYVTEIITHDKGRCLIEHLFDYCSEEKKLYLATCLLPNIYTLSKNRCANYMLSSIIHSLHDQNGNEIIAKRKEICWKCFCNVMTKDLNKFYELCTHKYASFVMKKFVQYCDYTMQQSLLTRLSEESEYLATLSEHRFGRYVYKKLLASFKSHKFVTRNEQHHIEKRE